MKYRPTYGTITEEPEPVQPKIHYHAVTNLPENGTQVRATLQDFVVYGKVRWASPEYGTFVLEEDIWIDRHFRGKVEVRIDIKTGWDIEILEDSK